MFLKTIDSGGDRWLLWPIRLSWGPKLSSAWFTTHGWQVDTERCSVAETGKRNMPGFRGVFGRTLHLGRPEGALRSRARSPSRGKQS